MKVIKAIARAVLPVATFEKLQAIRSRRHQMRLLQREGVLEAATRYVERNGCTVRYGPFAGTVYPRQAALSRHSIPKLLGTYEQELHGVIEEIGRRKYDVVIDIGSAEGYYAVGLARLLRTKVLAYDPEPIERSYCDEMARLNGMSALVTLKDLFRPSDMEQFRDSSVMCVCDCEGFEAEIFNAKTIQLAGKWDILIELHGDATEKLPKLSWPHKTSTIDMAPRRENYRELDGLGDQTKLLSEYRPCEQTWLWCDSRSRETTDKFVRV